MLRELISTVGKDWLARNGAPGKGGVKEVGGRGTESMWAPAVDTQHCYTTGGGWAWHMQEPHGPGT